MIYNRDTDTEDPIEFILPLLMLLPKFSMP